MGTPEKPKSYVGLIVAICVMAFLFGVGIMGAIGFFVYRQVKEREAVTQVEKAAEEERTKMAESIRSGNVSDGNAAIGRLKDQLGKTATQLTGSDAGAARAMAAYLGKIQAQIKTYDGAVERLRGEKVLQFEITDRAQIETHRQIVRDFMEANAKLTNALEHGEDMVRAELDAQKVPQKTRDGTLAGYTRSQAQLRPLQLHIRHADEVLGQSALEVLDLLDRTWGRWERDASTGRLRFQDDPALKSFNELVEKIQTTAKDQEKTQEELITKSREAQSH
jgi:hypothetical protein